MPTAMTWTWGTPTLTPVISAVSAVETAADTWQISWNLSDAATGQVFYDTTSHSGQSGDYAYSSTLETTPLLFHSQQLSGLDPDTTYYFVVVSTIGANAAVSVESSFTTAPSGVIASMYATDTYGMGIATDGKQDQRIGGALLVDYGFRFISRGGVLTGYVPQVRTGSGYSLGDGGKYEGQLWTVGMDGLPDTQIATLFTNWVPGDPGTDARYILVPFTVTPTLTAGTSYIMVTVNTHASPTTNYVAFNALWQASSVSIPPGLDGRRFAAFTDDFAVVLKSGGNWTEKNWMPNVDFRYGDGGHDGSAYIASYPTVAQTGVMDGASSMVRERITASQTIAISHIYARVSRSSGATGNVVLGLYSGWTGNSLIDSVTVSGASVQVYTPGSATRHGDWVGGALSQTRTVVANDQIHVRLTKSGGSGSFYVVPALCGPGAPNSSAMQSRSFTDGVAQRTTNGGSSWSDLYFSRTNLELYMVLV